MLACVAIGPVEFPGQPSLPVLILVTVGLSLFAVGQGTGAWCFRIWLQLREDPPASSNGALNIAVVVTSLLGLTGIALIAVDRVVLSGNAREYAELLRCTPSLIDVIEIKRTALLYAGYLTFSFGFVSLVLFVLKGEEVRGWAAILAQLSMLCPVGYALLYSGRMPILLAIVLVVAAVMVRIGQGQRPLPPGHHLLIKTIAVVVLFGIYTNAMVEPAYFLHPGERAGPATPGKGWTPGSRMVAGFEASRTGKNPGGAAVRDAFPRDRTAAGQASAAIPAAAPI